MPKQEEQERPVFSNDGGKPDSNNDGGVVWGGTGPSTLPNRNPTPKGGKPDTFSEKNVYANSGELGVGAQGEPIKVTALEAQSRVSNGEIRIGNFLGLITRPSRDNMPLGALSDCRNFILNKKIGSLSLRHGFASYTLPTTDVGSIVSLIEVKNFWVFKSEIPSTQTIKVVAGTDGSAVKHIIQSPFFPSSSTVNTGAVKWGESKSGTIANGLTVGTPSVELNSGFITTADYYKYWILYNTTRSEHLHILTSTTSGAGKITLTTSEYVPTDWVDGDAVTLYRHFHDNPTFAPSFNDSTSVPPIAVQQGQAILFSGGQSSTVGNKLIWSGYISKVFFSGATKTLPHVGTYVTEAEIKSNAGVSPQTIATTVITAGLENKLWFHCFVLEDEEGQRSQPVKAAVNYVVCAGGINGIRTSMRLSSQINKRIRKIHHFAGFSNDTTATSLTYEEYKLIGEVDLTSTGWTYNESGAASGYWARNFDVSATEWGQRGENLSEFLGHTQADNTTVSASLMEYVNNRLFVGRFYDYTAGQNFDDQLRFSGFGGNGVAQFNVLPNIDDQTQTTVEPGDSAVIRGFKRWFDQLFILKDNSCFSIQISGDPISWELVTVARIGCDLPRTIIVTPNGIVWAKLNDDVYFWDGGIPRPMTFWWRGTYQALTPTTAWYDSYLKSYVLVTSTSTFFIVPFDIMFQGEYVWTQHDILTAAPVVYLGWVVIGPSQEVFVSAGSGGGGSAAHQFINTATSDNNRGIAPYFKTAPIVLDEKNIAKYKWMHLISEGPVVFNANALGLKATTAGAVGSGATTWSNVSRTETKHVRGFQQASGIGRGTWIEFEYNPNWASTGATFTALQINELGFTYDIVPLRGDSMKTS